MNSSDFISLLEKRPEIYDCNPKLIVLPHLSRQASSVRRHVFPHAKFAVHKAVDRAVCAKQTAGSAVVTGQPCSVSSYCRSVGCGLQNVSSVPLRLRDRNCQQKSILSPGSQALISTSPQTIANQSTVSSLEERHILSNQLSYQEGQKLTRAINSFEHHRFFCPSPSLTTCSCGSTTCALQERYVTEREKTFSESSQRSAFTPTSQYIPSIYRQIKYPAATEPLLNKYKSQIHHCQTQTNNTIPNTIQSTMLPFLLPRTKHSLSYETWLLGKDGQSSESAPELRGDLLNLKQHNSKNTSKKPHSGCSSPNYKANEMFTESKDSLNNESHVIVMADEPSFHDDSVDLSIKSNITESSGSSSVYSESINDSNIKQLDKKVDQQSIYSKILQMFKHISVEDSNPLVDGELEDFNNISSKASKKLLYVHRVTNDKENDFMVLEGTKTAHLQQIPREKAQAASPLLTQEICFSRSNCSNQNLFEKILSTALKSEGKTPDHQTRGAISDEIEALTSLNLVSPIDCCKSPGTGSNDQETIDIVRKRNNISDLVTFQKISNGDDHTISKAVSELQFDLSNGTEMATSFETNDPDEFPSEVADNQTIQQLRPTLADSEPHSNQSIIKESNLHSAKPAQALPVSFVENQQFLQTFILHDVQETALVPPFVRSKFSPIKEMPSDLTNTQNTFNPLTLVEEEIHALDTSIDGSSMAENNTLSMLTSMESLMVHSEITSNTLKLESTMRTELNSPSACYQNFQCIGATNSCNENTSCKSQLDTESDSSNYKTMSLQASSSLGKSSPVHQSFLVHNIFNSFVCQNELKIRNKCEENVFDPLSSDNLIPEIAVSSEKSSKSEKDYQEGKFRQRISMVYSLRDEMNCSDKFANNTLVPKSLRGLDVSSQTGSNKNQSKDTCHLVNNINPEFVLHWMARQIPNGAQSPEQRQTSQIVEILSFDAKDSSDVKVSGKFFLEPSTTINETDDCLPQKVNAPKLLVNHVASGIPVRCPKQLSILVKTTKRNITAGTEKKLQKKEWSNKSCSKIPILRRHCQKQKC